MRKARYSFIVHPSHVSERLSGKYSPAGRVKALALKKAVFVSKRFPKHVVLGADTLVFINGHAVGKPTDVRHAQRMLAELSGRWQDVMTGVAVVWDGGKRRLSETAVSKVKFRTLSREEIQRAAHKHLDKAGSYAVQEKGDGFVETIRGDYDNVVGLPMRVVRRLLRRAAHALSKRVGHNIHF